MEEEADDGKKTNRGRPIKTTGEDEEEIRPTIVTMENMIDRFNNLRGYTLKC